MTDEEQRRYDREFAIIALCEEIWPRVRAQLRQAHRALVAAGVIEPHQPKEAPGG